MWRCPYCNTRLDHPEPEHIPMSQKRRAVYDYVAKAGPEGVKKEDIVQKFFSACTSETILRTTIHYINSAIKPVRIHSRGGIVRLMRPDQ